MGWMVAWVLKVYKDHKAMLALMVKMVLLARRVIKAIPVSKDHKVNVARRETLESKALKVIPETKGNRVYKDPLDLRVLLACKVIVVL
jgi:hypothetical protein